MTAYYNEIDAYAAQWLRNLIAAGHIAPGDVDERDIRDVRPSELRKYTQCHFFAGIGVWSYAARLAGWPDDRPFWSGSCPCQPFSAAGPALGFADERHLWPAWHHLIKECAPHSIFGEQVASPDGLGWLDLVQTDLEATGYAFAPVDLCAAGIGAPHIRQRLWFVANANGHGRQPRQQRRATARHRQAAESNRSVGRMANADGRHASAEREQRGGEHGQLTPDRVAREPGNTSGEGLAIGSQSVEQPRALRIEGTALGAAEPLRGFWQGADWIWCRDGKYRPVEPGTFPLAHGATSRVGRLRAYGNAINAEAAKTFITAAMEILK